MEDRNATGATNDGRPSFRLAGTVIITDDIYSSANNHLPPPTAGAQFENRGSTLVLLLPYLKEGSLHVNYKLENSIDDESNSVVTIPVYLCPEISTNRPVLDTECGDCSRQVAM